MWRLFRKFSEDDARHAAVGRHAVGRGLWLCRSAEGETVWEVSLSVDGQTRDQRVGVYPEMSVKQARTEARKWRGLLRRGLDPAQERNRLRRAAARNLHEFFH